MTNKFQIINSKSQTGFTLVEMLISISIFMIFTGIIAGSFSTLVRANRDANNTQKIYREARYVFDTLAEEIRSGRLDFACIGPQKDENGAVIPIDAECFDNQNLPKTVLAVMHDGDMRRNIFKAKDGKIQIKKEHKISLQSNWIIDADWQPLTSAEFQLKDFQISFFPLRNPYDAANADDPAVQWQPSVEITLSTGAYTFRTTYSSRTYGERQLYKNL